MDIVIITVPGENSYSIPSAPALLIASIKKAGFSSKFFDFNVKFKNLNLTNFLELENYFITGNNKNIFYNEAYKIIENFAQKILENSPKFLGISVFTYQNRIATEIFCDIIKKKSNIKIILGGQGITDGGLQGKTVWVSNLKENNLIDYWIRSEGENSLVNLLKGNESYIGINSDTFLQINDLDSIEYPNYDDYNFDEYSSKLLPVLSSRGCVKECTFCDIHEHWQYRYRKGNKVAEELIFLSQKYNINFFHFTDSLVNGNLKEFKIFLQTLAEYNSKNKPIEWKGQFIIRSKKTLKEDYWELLKKGGAKSLTIGIESGSENVRKHMKKFFSNEDVDYTLEMLQKYNIKCSLLFLIGYVTETEQDFNDTVNMLERYKNYIDNTIVAISLGQTLGILPNTYLYEHANELNLVLDKNENNWFLSNNQDYDIFERMNRLSKIAELTKEWGYESEINQDLLKTLENNFAKFSKINKIKQKNLNKN